MAQFLKCPDHVLASNIVYSHVYVYILPELRPCLHNSKPNESTKLVEDNGEEVIQKMLDKSNNQLRMYGSAKELAENIKIFRSFSDSFRFFKDQQYPFNATPVIYNSLNGEKYLCKPDIYTIIQNIALHTINHHKSLGFHLMLAKVLRSKIVLTDGHLEFVKFDEKMFDEIEKEMREGEKKSVEQAVIAHLKHLGMSFLTKNYAAIVSKLRELNPSIWDDDMANALLIQLQYSSRTQMKAQKEGILTWLTNTCIVNCIVQIMEKRAPLFMSTPDTSPITVRLFEDGEERYVMEAELYHALNRLSTGYEIFEIRNDGLNFEGMSMNDVEKKYGDRIQTIEFIHTPILRSKHRAVPIKSHFPGQFVIPAVDLFFEFWRNVILGQKLFQKYQCSDWKKFAPTFHNIEEFLYTGKKEQYFLTTDIRVESVVGNSLKQFKVSSINEVRNVKKSGFTVQNLKEELKYLGLTNTFPEIQDYAEDVYEEIYKAKKERYLKTCDLFDAVESCQLICVLNRVPNLKMFVHNQKGCGRVFGYKCEHCEEKKDASDETEEELQKPLKNLKIESSEETRSQKEEEEVPNLEKNPTNEGFNDSDDDKENQNPIKDQKTSKKMVSDIMNLLAQRSKVPIEILTENSEECISESQQQSQLQMELKEKISVKTEENQRLQETILKLTAENEANQRVIQQLLDKLTVGRQKKDMEEVSDDSGALLAVRIPPVVICYVCHKEIEPSDDDWLDCSRTGEKFHQVCAYFHIRIHEECPACDDKIPNYF
ncbi:hypothetical protein CRE_22673 [Caenorhabditis remanei]|uniref:DUF7809 domain-containing protein n=1 Tax=Caenorhabditis remanei TaxID=31234 RepID=E3NFK3_CAERE|nr:hypothetical protein CRE_22673 [Caenorhabditis remanei]